MSQFKQAVIISVEGSDHDIVIEDFSDRIRNGEVEETVNAISYASEHLIKRVMGDVEITSDIMGSVFEKISHHSALFCNGGSMQNMNISCQFNDTYGDDHRVNIDLRRAEMHKIDYFTP